MWKMIYIFKLNFKIFKKKWMDCTYDNIQKKWLENLDIYSIGAAELPLEFPNCTPLPKGDGDTSNIH